MINIIKINYEKIILIFLKVETFSNRILIGVPEFGTLVIKFYI